MAPALEALAEKYRELLALRRGGGDVRPRLRALAARFPGALRELDEQPIEALERRLEALEAALAGRQPPPPWAAWMLSYHAWLRVALRVRRARTVRPRSLEAAHAAVTAYAPEAAEEPAALTVEDACAMLAPPRGRLAPWALSRAAAEHSVPEDAIAGVLFARRA